MIRFFLCSLICLTANLASASNVEYDIYKSPSDLPKTLQKEKIWRGMKAKDFLPALELVTGSSTWIENTSRGAREVISRLKYFDFSAKQFVFEITVIEPGQSPVSAIKIYSAESMAAVEIVSNPENCNPIGKFESVTVPAGTFRACRVKVHEGNGVTHFFPVPGGSVREEVFYPDPIVRVLTSYERYPLEIWVRRGPNVSK